MTSDDNIESVLEQWFTEGPRRMPERLFEATFERIEHVPAYRLADLPMRLAGVKRNARLAAAAAILVVLAGTGLVVLNRVPGFGTQPSAAPRGSAIGAALQAEWASVGLRTNPRIPMEPGKLTIGPASIDIEQANGDVGSSWSVTDDGSRLIVRFVHGILDLNPGIQKRQWECDPGAEGTYGLSLDAERQLLTLNLVADRCAPRAAFLPGRWTRSTCSGDGTCPALRERFASRIHGYSIAYPAGWAIRPAVVPWQPGSADLSSDAVDAVNDHFAKVSIDTLTVSSQAILEGTTFADWLIGYHAGLSREGDGCPLLSPANWTPVTIGGVSGLRWGNSMNCNWFGGAVVGVGGRAYVFRAQTLDIQGNRGAGLDPDRTLQPELFLAMLASVEFDPASALDIASATPGGP